ncbi:GAF and ANTAR domain-containing protein [uncultured Cellulomonas sp.]|uniref:GAF and ANTAR domain-containing protein n=1 Tax=uncultured Cellulomonas sp. TaxID=189682 RepID=UPI0026043DA2|nr:GAF and ANTAR domain-containing protein [uncultured Cellulomonas sp.]
MDMDAHRDGDQVAEQLAGMTSIEAHLDVLAIRASHHLGGGMHCSLILRRQGVNRRVASSSLRSAACDDAENRAGSGPCLTAIDELRTVLVPDVRLEEAWPAWCGQVLASGFRSGAAFPVAVGAGADIAFNLYSEDLDPWDRTTVVHADAYAQQAGEVMSLCLEVARLTRGQQPTVPGADVGPRVNRAVGVLMAREHVDAPTALVALRTRSSEQGVDLADVADRVVAGLDEP